MNTLFFPFSPRFSPLLTPSLSYLIPFSFSLPIPSSSFSLHPFALPSIFLSFALLSSLLLYHLHSILPVTSSSSLPLSSPSPSHLIPPLSLYRPPLLPSPPLPLLSLPYPPPSSPSFLPHPATRSLVLEERPAVQPAANVINNPKTNQATGIICFSSCCCA